MPDYPPQPPSASPLKLRDRVRRLGYAKRTEQSYVHWVKRYIRFHGKRHPGGMGNAEWRRFCGQSGGGGHVTAATQSARAQYGLRQTRATPDLRFYAQSPVRIDASPGLGKNNSSQSGRSGMTTSVVMPGRYRRVST
jgi:hypothetical protein